MAKLFSAKSLLFLASLNSLASALANEENNSDVVDLTGDTFPQFILENSPTLIQFFAPWCGHCRVLAPKYDEAAAALKEYNIKIAKVDCTANDDLCRERKVPGYPTLKVFTDGKDSPYSGARAAYAIVSFMKKQILSAVSNITSKNSEQLKNSDPHVVDALSNIKDNEAYRVFEQNTEQLTNDFTIGAVISDNPFMTKENTIRVFKQFKEGKDQFDGEIEEAELTKFVKASSVPLVDEVGPENYSRYVDARLPIVFAFFSNDEEHEKLKTLLGPVVRKFKGNVSVVTIDGTKFPAQADFLNLKQEWPAFAINDDTLKFPFDQSKELTEDSLSEFVDQFVQGGLKQSIRSKPIPENNDAPIRVLLSDQFSDTVLNKKKDVLVHFYAPWCGHCNRLAPIYDELGEIFKGEDSIVIVKFDPIANSIPPEVPVKIYRLPTLKLFKAESNEIVDYSGNRSLESIFHFLKENTHNSFDAKLPTKEEETPKEDEKEELLHD